MPSTIKLIPSQPLKDETWTNNKISSLYLRSDYRKFLLTPPAIEPSPEHWSNHKYISTENLTDFSQIAHSRLFRYSICTALISHKHAGINNRTPPRWRLNKTRYLCRFCQIRFWTDNNLKYWPNIANKNELIYLRFNGDTKLTAQPELFLNLFNEITTNQTMWGRTRYKPCWKH